MMIEGKGDNVNKIMAVWCLQRFFDKDLKVLRENDLNRGIFSSFRSPRIQNSSFTKNGESLVLSNSCAGHEVLCEDESIG